jgi:hypothetical protein
MHRATGGTALLKWSTLHAHALKYIQCTVEEESDDEQQTRMLRMGGDSHREPERKRNVC